MCDKEQKKFVAEPGTCIPWRIKKEELGELPGNEEIVKKEWEKLEAFAYSFIWFWVQR